MKIDLNDPKLTAFALGELSPDEMLEFKRALHEAPDARQLVSETAGIATLLRSEFEAEGAAGKIVALSRPQGARETSAERGLSAPTAAESQRWNSDTPWSVSRRLALAASITVVAAAVALSVSNVRDRLRPAAPISVLMKAKTAKAVFAEIEQDRDRVVTTGSNIPAPEEQVAQAAATPPGAPFQLGNEIAKEAPASRQIPAAPPVPAKADAPPFGSYRSVTGAVDRVAGVADAPRFSEDERRPGEDKSIRGDREFNTASYDHLVENPFLGVQTNPLSTFSVDVDTASYSNIRRFINSGSLPPKDAVRVEELINYFPYDYPQPDGAQPFSVNLDVAGCPWAPDHRLVRVGLKGRETMMNNRPASNLVFLLDVSGSMQAADRLPLIKESMRLLVAKLTDNDRVAIVVYAGGSGVALPSTRGDRKDEILTALEELRAGGSTNGAEGIELAYRIAADHFIKGGVNRVILATDGDFNVGVTSQGELIRLIQEKAKSGVFLSVLGVGNDNLKDSTMQKLADKGNGNYAYLDGIDEARKVLVRQMNGTLETIAKDVKVQVEFNPESVASYRLIGYEKRMLRKEDFNNDKIDAGEIGAGHTVTALYEVVPVGNARDPVKTEPPIDPLKYQSNASPAPAAVARGSSEMLTVKLRYKKPDGDKSELIERSLVDDRKSFENASSDFRFAAAVAEFGMILRNSEHKGSGTLAAVLEWAVQAKGSDASEYRTGFIELARKTRSLSNG